MKDMFSSRLGGFLDTKIVIVQQPMGVSPLGNFLIWISVHSIALISQDLKQMILVFATNGSRHCCRAKWLHDVHVPASYCFYPGPILGLDRDMY